MCKVNLIDLPNVGKVLAGLLCQSGINTPEKLKDTGSKKAFLMIREVDPTACLHMLYGLEGAVRGIRDTGLSPGTKEDLKKFFKNL